MYKEKRNGRFSKNIFLKLALVIVLLFAFIILNSTLKKEELEIDFKGSGTKGDPYQILTGEDFINLSQLVQAGNDFSETYFVQKSDITFNNEEIIPIGSIAEDTRFCGLYNGRGYTISCFTLNDTALFENMDGILENICLKAAKIQGENAVALVKGGEGQIYNCLNKVSIKGDKSASGIACEFDGLIFNCVNLGILDAPVVADILTSGDASVMLGTGLYQTVSGDCKGENYVPQLIQNYSTWKIIEDILNDNNILYGSLGYEFALEAIRWESTEGDLYFNPDQKVYFAGEGTVINPYQIKDAEDLLLIEKLSNSGAEFKDVYFELTDDIIIDSTCVWTGIATSKNSVFNGILDGNGHSITLENGNRFIGNLGGTLVDIDISFDKREEAILVKAIEKTGGIFNCIVRGEGDKCNIADSNNGYIENVVLIGNKVFDWEDSAYTENEYAALIEMLNNNLSNLVMYYGLHYDQLHIWELSSEQRFKLKSTYSLNNFLEKAKNLEGNGSYGNPFLINNFTDLVVLRENIYYGITYEGQYFKQTSDIDLSICKIWKPISESNLLYHFCGKYDGNSHIIKNLSSEGGENNDFIGTLYGDLYNLGIQTKGINHENHAVIHCLVAGKVYNCYLTGENGEKSSSHYIYINNGELINVYAFLKDSFLCYSGTGNIQYSYSNKKLTDKYFEGKITDSAVVNDIESTVQKLNKNIFYLGTQYNIPMKTLNVFIGGRQIGFGDKYRCKVQDYLQYYIYQLKNNYIIFVSSVLLLLCLIVGILRAIIYKKKIINECGLFKTKNITGELLCIFLTITLFIDSITINKGILNQIPQLIIFNGISILLFGFLIKNIKKKEFLKSLFNWISVNWLLLVGIILLVLSMVAVIGFPYPAYDANLYYGEFVKAFDSFDFSIASFFYNFIFWGNVSYGYVLFTAIGESFFQGQFIGVYIVNIVLFFITLLCLNKVLEVSFPKFNIKFINVLTLIFAIMPYGLSNIFYLTPDFYHMIFIVILLYCYVKNFKILFGFCGFILVFSKSNAGLSYLSFIIILFIIQYIKEDGKIKEKIRSIFKEFPVFYWISPIFIFAWAKYVLSFSNRIVINDVDKWENSIAYNLTKFCQFFVYGFRWGIILLIIILVLPDWKKIKGRKFDRRNLDNKSVVLLAALSLIGILQTILIFKMKLDPCPRYTAFMNCWYIFGIAFVLNLVSCSKDKKKIILGCAFVILFIQCFKTIDPSILLFNNNYKAGENTRYSLIWKQKFDLYGDMYVYNGEYNVYDKINKIMLNDWKINENITVYINAEDIYPLALGNNSRYILYWDREKNRRSFLTGNNKVVINILPLEQLTQRKNEESVYIIQICGKESSDRIPLNNISNEQIYSKNGIQIKKGMYP